MASKGPVPDWLRLQNKIFSRWVHQKVHKRNIVVNDVVKKMSEDPSLLITLLEVLSEKKYEGKLAVAKVRSQTLDNATNALNFLKSCGIAMKQPPSAENIVDGSERDILGLVWAIMLKYLKFGDEEDGEQLNAKDALLMWVQNKTTGYGIKVENFKSHFHDGLALCALIHKHRPKMVDYNGLDKSAKVKNLQIAMDAAEKYFGLEQYLTAEDIPKLDENSMVVYVSEYFYGIAEQRKLDLAAKRIGKVIKLTKENDAAKKEYNQRAQELKELMTKVEKILEDRSIDNTMAGAKRRLNEFYDYKKKDKNVILGTQLDLVALYNNLAMILAHNKRPVYNPPAGLSLKDIEKCVTHLEECEAERKVALHKELNRQIKLLDMDNQHKSRYAVLKVWLDEKKAYLSKKEIVESVSAAHFQLRTLDAYEKESTAVQEGSFAQIKKLFAELESEKYERTSEVKARVDEVEQYFTTLNGLAKAKRPVLDDDLARELFKAAVRLLNKEHIDDHKKIMTWVGEKENYLNQKEVVESVDDARTQLSLLEGYEKEKVSTNNTSVAGLKTLGVEIKAKKYETQYSSWVFENPAEIDDREASVAKKWESLSNLSAAKKAVLDADLARELEKERLRLEFAHLASEFTRWTKDQSEDVAVSHFGFNLEEVEAYQKVLSKSDADLAGNADKLKSEFESVHKNMTEMGVKENIYTTLTLQDLAKSRSTLDSAIASRKAAYEKELARQRANDALCKEFAGLAEPFVKWISDKKDEITNSSADLEVQLSNVVKCLGSLDNDGAKLKDINATDAKMEAAGIVDNRHTLLTAKDVEVQWDQYKIFLDKKQKMLQGEIERNKLRGITQEQFQEIEANFKQFDQDNSGSIDRKELKACLYSLGEEKSSSEIEKILKDYGDGKAIKYEGFKELMIDTLGVTDTKDDIINSFQLINRGAEVAKVEHMDIIMEGDDMEYIKATAPKVAEGYNYTAWTDDVFSR